MIYGTDHRLAPSLYARDASQRPINPDQTANTPLKGPTATRSRTINYEISRYMW